MLLDTRKFFTGLVLLNVVVPMHGQSNGKSQDDTVRLNEIQVIGTHNSYHAGLAPSEAKLLAKIDPVEARALDYRHTPLEAQLAAGMRELELDVYPDPEGGRYVASRGLKDVVAAGLPPDDPRYYPDGLMAKPGFKVMHKPDTDYRSNCQPFVECLRQIRKWSAANPGHVPVFLFIETKVPTTLKPRDMDDLDSEVRSVFSPKEMVTPDDVRGERASLREAVQKDGWPSLVRCRGKVVFLMAREEVADVYRVGHPQLRGRVMFINGKLSDPDTVFTVQSKNKHGGIQQLVADGMLVLTRADADMVEARIGDTRRREAAFESGAQLVSTDYPVSEPAVWSGYTVQFAKGEVARCNPVLRPKGCSNGELEPVTGSALAETR
ncbi:MAG: Ca2+-dependent phosphoinositide-specific phospholipase C [Edaphobacter sp.]